MLPIHDELIPWIAFKFQVRLRRDIASELQFNKFVVLLLIGYSIERWPIRGSYADVRWPTSWLCKLDPSRVLFVHTRSPQPTLYVELLAHVAHRCMISKVQEPLLSSWYTSHVECTCFPTLPPSHHSFKCTFVFKLYCATSTKVGFCVVEGEK